MHERKDLSLLNAPTVTRVIRGDYRAIVEHKKTAYACSSVVSVE